MKKLLIVVIGFILFAVMVNLNAKDEPKKVVEKEPELTQEEIEKQEYQDWLDSLFTLHGSIRDIEEGVKQRMNNPDSFEHVETQWQDMGQGKGIEFVMTYRGTNAFGGVVTNQVKGTYDYKTRMYHVEVVR